MKTHLLFLALSLFLLAPMRLALGAPVDPATATLYDVCFADLQNGWAVGNGGTILHTADGGKTWETQESGTRYTLRGVCFVDGQHGWAVGGKARMDRQGGVGVILRTDDGGETWGTQAFGLTGYLYGVRFANAQVGWAVGEAVDSCDGSVVRTEDGGQTWRWEPTGTHRSLAGIAGSGTAAFAVADDDPIFRRESAGTWPVAKAGRNPLHLHAVAMGNDRNVWAVGERATILHSPDAGATWTPQATDLDPSLARSFDLADVDFVDAKTGWAVGYGPLALHTSDGGKTWSSQRTGVRNPLNGVEFVDAAHGWAVGEGGAVVATADGGQTWTTQRAGLAQVKLLVSHAHHDDELMQNGPLIARSADLGYPVALHCTTADDCHEYGSSGDPTSQEYRDVANTLGAIIIHDQRGFQLSGTNSHEWTKAQWDAEYGDGFEELERQIVAMIRTWQPEVIVTHEPIWGDYNKFEHIWTGRITARAFASAADPKKFPEQIVAGLDPWQAKRLYYAVGWPLRSGENPVTHVLDTKGYSARQGATYAWLPSRGIQYYWSKWVGGNFPNLSGRASKLHLARSIGDDVVGDLFPDAADRATALEATRPEEVAAWTKLSAGLNTKSPEARTAALQAFVTENPKHPLAAAVLLQLARGAEGNDRAGAIALYEQFIAKTQDREEAYRAALRIISVLDAAGQNQQADAKCRALPAQFPEVAEARDGLLLLGDRARTRGDDKTAFAAYQEYERTANPPPGRVEELQFKRGVLLRKLSRLADARQELQSAGRGHSIWSQHARAELALLDGAALPASEKQVLARRLTTAPTLDGNLDDPAWKAAQFATNFNSVAPGFDSELQPTEFAVAYDSDHLYLAFICHEQHMDGVSTPDKPLNARQSWDDNSVFLSLYPDRDYARSFLLEVTSIGKASPEWSTIPWKPEVRTAAAYGKDRWTIEIAIPWKDTNRQPKSGDVWNLTPGRQRNRLGAEFAFSQYTLWGLPYALPKPYDRWGFTGYVRFE